MAFEADMPLDGPDAALKVAAGKNLCIIDGQPDICDNTVGR